MALQYELEVLENFVAKTLHPARLKQTDSIVPQIPQWRELIASETDRIRKQFIHTVFNSKERQRELYIQYHQVQLIRMADQLFQYLAIKNPKSIYQTGRDNLITTLYKETFRCTEDLLNYIEQYFASYFDKDADVPRVYLLLNQRSLRSSIKALRVKLTGLNANVDFIDVLLTPLSAFCQKKKASYRELIYIKDVLRNLTACEAISEVKDLLVSMNFNSCPLVSQWIGEMVNTLNGIGETKDRAAQLSKWQKEINQIPVKPNVVLKPNCVSLRDQLSQWITEELKRFNTSKPGNGFYLWLHPSKPTELSMTRKNYIFPSLLMCWQYWCVRPMSQNSFLTNTALLCLTRSLNSVVPCKRKIPEPRAWIKNRMIRSEAIRRKR